MNRTIHITIFVLLISVFIYTVSYGAWTWKHNNKIGAVMVFILALAVVAFPIYVLFFRFA